MKEQTEPITDEHGSWSELTKKRHKYEKKILICFHREKRQICNINTTDVSLKIPLWLTENQSQKRLEKLNMNKY